MTVSKGRGRSRNSAAIQAAVNAKNSRSSLSYIDMGAVAELYANLQAEFALSGGEVSSSLQSVPGPNEQTRIQADVSTLLTHIEDRLSTCNEELTKVKRIGQVIQEERRKRRRVKREDEDDEEDVDDVQIGSGSSVGSATSGKGKRNAAAVVDDVSVKKEEVDVRKAVIDVDDSNARRAESVDSEPERSLADEIAGKGSIGTVAGSGGSGSDIGAGSSVAEATVPTTTSSAKSEKSDTVIPYKLEPEKSYYDPPTPVKHSAADFAEIQAASITALGLFDESITVDSEGNPVTDIEVLKKKYGVAAFPQHDLKDLLPGAIPDDDFTRAKPANQVQFSTFATYIEPYFRPLTEEDTSFLKHKSVGLDGSYTRTIASPYVIPPLGQLYSDSWAEEDGSLTNNYTFSPPPSGTIDGALYRGNGSSEGLGDDILDTFSAKVSVGPLASRLLSALMREPGDEDEIRKEQEKEKEETKVKIEDDAASIGSTPSVTAGSAAANDGTTSTPSKPAVAMIEPAKSSPVKADYSSLEERLKREFRYVGILDVNLLRKEDKKNKRLGSESTNGTSATSGGDDMFEIDWANGTEDDEICYEIRKLQKKFKQVTKLNQACKRTLLPIVQEQMAYQEYAQILEDLDKQVDQAYLKRMRSIPKGKKKKGFGGSSATAGGGSGSTPNTSTADQKPPSYKPLLEKRLRWIEKIGAYFQPPEIMKRTPTDSIFSNIQIDDDEDDPTAADQNDDDDDMYNMTL